MTPPSPFRYHDVEAYLSTGLVGLGYGTANPDVSEVVRTMPTFLPGPFTQQELWKVSAGPIVLAVLGNGMGVAKEGIVDQPFVTIRVIGMQNSFEYAETLAYDLDSLMLAVTGNHKFPSGAVALYFNRTGGAPQLVDYDAAQRYHFQTTYITKVAR